MKEPAQIASNIPVITGSSISLSPIPIQIPNGVDSTKVAINGRDLIFGYSFKAIPKARAAGSLWTAIATPKVTTSSSSSEIPKARPSITE